MRRSKLSLALLATTVALASIAGGSVFAQASSNLTVTITGGPSGTVNSSSATFTFSANEAATFTCKLDAGAASACSSPKPYDLLADGGHTFTVTATNGGGAGAPNSSSDSRSWTIDTRGAPPPFPTGPRGDVDGDGLAGVSDRCPLTPDHARAIARGCAAIEIAGSPELFTGPALGSLAGVTRWFHTRNPTFKRFGSNTRRARKAILQAQLLMADGSVCAASHSFASGLKTLRSATGSLPRIERPLKTILRRHQGNIDTNPGFEGLAIGGGYAKFAVRDAAAGADAFRAACNAVAGRLHRKGRVTSVDSAHGRILIAAVPFGLTPHPHGQPPFAGGNANVNGTAFKDGTGIIASNKETGAVANTGPPAQIKCEFLRIAPIQTFDAPVQHTIVLHDPLGYQTGGKLRLEQGMRLGAHDACGSGGGNTPGATFTRRSLRLVLDYKNAATTLPATATITSDLAEGDPPAPFPANVDNFTDATLTAHEQSQTCQLAVNGLACSKPVETGSPQKYKLRLQPRGSYATAHYDTTEFNLEGQPYGTYAPAHVDSVPMSPSLGGTNAAFHALGYPITNSGSTRPNEGDIFQGTAFAVYLDDFFAPDDAFAVDITGVDHPSGLEWPRVEGTRGGHPFWYLTKTPTLTKDFLHACTAPGDPSAYSKLPWTPDLPGWKLFNGNFDDPSGQGHPDTGKNYGNNQKYAYDFAFDSNNNGIGESFLDIRAARDGIVYALQDGENGNSYKTGTKEEDQTWTAPHPAGYNGVGNFIVIKLANGRYSSYWHLKKGGFHVKVGDRVTRGQLIATSDNTGNSTTPHMHFDVRSGWDLGYPPSTIEFPSTRVTFEDKNHACWRPLVGDALASDNSGG